MHWFARILYYRFFWGKSNLGAGENAIATVACCQYSVIMTSMFTRPCAESLVLYLAGPYDVTCAVCFMKAHLEIIGRNVNTI